MATNKHKDAAALFELLGNSTLKVPKNAGSLKIPSWWSSKANPASERIDSDLEAGHSVAVVDATPKVVVPRPAPAARVETNSHRLFDPPPVTQMPGATPSIRPPTTTSSPTPEPIAQASMPAAHRVAGADEVAPRDPQIFEPQMYAEKRRQWATPRPGAFARLPNWVLFAGLGTILLIIAGTVIAAHHRDKKASAATPNEHPTAGDAVHAAGSGVPGPSTAQTYTPVPVPRADKPAKSYDPGQIARTPDLYYVIIARTPVKAVAEKNAQFLASHGIDVSTEIDVKTALYVIISVQGFLSTTAAKPYKDRIIEIGHLTADYKRTGRAWDDATALNGLKMTIAQ